MIGILIGVGLLLLIAYGMWQDSKKEERTIAQVVAGAKFRACYGDDNPFTRKDTWYIVGEVREDYVKIHCYVEGLYKETSTMQIKSLLMWYYFVEE